MRHYYFYYSFIILLLLVLFLKVSVARLGESGYTLISPKTPTRQCQPVREMKRKKQWKTKSERVAQVNKEVLTLLLKPSGPTPSNMQS